MRHSSIRFAILSLLGWLAAGFIVSARGGELKSATVGAYDRYVRLTEARMAEDLHQRQFLITDSLPGDRRNVVEADLREGKANIQRLRTLDQGREIPVPSGMIQHWSGVIFVPSATLSQAYALLVDYPEYAAIYQPDIQRSKMLERNGNRSKTYLRLYKKSLVTAEFNAYFDNLYIPLGRTLAQMNSCSTRIAEIANPGKPDEHELPVGMDHGYLWRLCSYWRIEEKNGGVYLQIEVIALSRNVPPLIAPLMNPIIADLSKSSIFALLDNTRRAIVKRYALPGGSNVSSSLEPPRAR